MLHDCEGTNEQIHLTLDAVRDSLVAGAVLWYSGIEREVEPSSEEFLSSDWCCQVMEASSRSQAGGLPERCATC